MLGKLGSYVQKNEMEPLSYTTRENKLKTDQGPNARPETIRVLEERAGSNFSDIGYRNIFPDVLPKARGTKAKINY